MPTFQSPEDRFLEYSRIAFRRVHGLASHNYANELADFPELLSLARKHRMIAILYAGLPHDVMTPWQSKAFAQAGQSARYTDETIKLLKQMGQAISPAPILIKGPGLAIQAWPDPALRVYDDFDFRCRRQDFPAFQKVARASGYLPYKADSDMVAHLWHFGWGVTFHHPDGFYLEVNHRLFPKHFPCPRELGTSDNCLPVTNQIIDGENLPLPTPAAHLVLASAHALWHGGERLAWIADIAGLLVRHPGIVPQALVICGRHTFLRRALIAACLLAEQLFGPDLFDRDPSGLAPVVNKAENGNDATHLNPCDRQPDLVGSQRQDKTFDALLLAARNTQILAVCETYRQQLIATSPPNHAERRRLQRLLCNKREAWRAFALRALTPGEPDFSRLHLTPEQRNRYWLYRPLRILRAGTYQ